MGNHERALIELKIENYQILLGPREIANEQLRVLEKQYSIYDQTHDEHEN